MGIDEHDHEGRLITLEFPDFYFVTCYTPNSQNELARLPYRMKWEDDFRSYLQHLAETKGVVLCGDLNVAHEEIDLKNPKTNHKKCRFFRCRTTKDDTIINRRIHRYVALFLSRRNRHLFLVELPFQGPSK
jgi:exodeoxyribonuclease III